MAGISTNTIRTITIQGQGQDSLDSLKGSLDSVTQAQSRLATTSAGVASVTDAVTKRQLSAEDAYRRQTLSVDATAAAQARLASQVKVLDAAMAQGVIKSSDEYSQRLGLLQQKYGQAQVANDSFHGSLDKLHQVYGVVAGAAAAFGVAMGAAELVEYGKRVFDTTAELKTQADQVFGAGGNVEALQALRAVFLANNISADDGDKLLSHLTKTLGEAAEGSQKAQDAFKELHLGSQQLAGKTGDAALPLVVDQLLQIKDAATRAAIETAIFSRSGQELESALTALHHPMADIIDQAKTTGQVIDEDMIEKAHEAKDQMTEAFTKLNVAIAPLVTEWANDFSEFATSINGSTTELEGFIDKAKVLLGLYAGARVGGAIGGVPGAIVGGAVSGLVAYGAVNADSITAKAIANYQNELGSGTLSPSEAADIKGRLARLQTANPGATGQTNTGALYTGLTPFNPAANDNFNIPSVAPDAGTSSAAPAWKPTQADIDAYKKIKETYADFLKELQEGAQVASETAAQRETELDTIKAAQIAEKEHGIAARDTSRTYAEAVTYLGQQRVEQVALEESTKRVNALLTDHTVQQALITAGSQVDADHRALVLKNLQDEIAAGGVINANGQLEIHLTDKATQAIVDKNAELQKGQDSTGLRDYLQGLREEASLAGLSADERERQGAALQAMHQYHVALGSDQSNEIIQIVAARQETERWRQVVDGIAGAFQDFFDKVLTTGKASFGDLWNAIKGQFAQMLAWMASQALIQPIIVPMVSAFAGSLGLSPGIGGAAGGGTLGLVANGASLASSTGLFGTGGNLFSSGGFLGGPTADGLGLSLGGVGAYGAGSATALFGGGVGEALGGGDFIGTAGSGLTSVLGGLGPLLGGAGVGALVSSLIFGSKNDASIGGLGGAAAGALIGSIIPGVGTIIGGLLGGLAGGGLGSITGSSNQGAIANFSDGGANSYLFKQGGGNNGQLSLQATQTVSQAISTLQAAGVNIGLGNITGLSIGSDKSYVYDSAGGKQKLAGGDVQSVIDAVLARILPSAAGTTPEAQAVLAKYNANGGINSGNLAQLESDLGAAKNFADAVANLKTSNDVLDDTAQKINAINSQYTDLVNQAQQLGIDIGNITDAKNSALRSLLDSSVQQLGALAGAANDNVSQWQQWAASITAAEKSATEAATALGSGLDEVATAAASARLGMASSFNQQISDAILSISDPATLAYNQMLEAQAQRLQDATSAGADLNQVYQLNTLEQQQFAAQQLQQQQQQAQDQIDALQQQQQQDEADAAQKVTDAHNALTGAYNSEQQALQATIDKYQQLSQSLRGYLGSLTGSTSGAAGYASTKAAFNLISSQAVTGDQTALGGLQQAGQDFLTASQANSQTLAQYTHDRALVTGAVSAAIGASDANAGAANDQLDALNASVQGLLTINSSVLTVKQAIDDLNDATAAQGAQTAANTKKLVDLITRLSRGGDALVTVAA